MNTWGWVEDSRGGALTQNPTVSAFDSGFTLGFGVFETMKTRLSKVQFLDLHLHRMSISAQKLQLQMPPSLRIEQAIGDVLQANAPEGFGRMRVSLTHGVKGETLWTLVITWQPVELWTQPAHLTVSEISQTSQRLSSSMKTLSYLENAFALEQALSKGFDDAILFDTTGLLTETALANLFIVKNQRVFTPRATSGCLLGVTRNIILNELHSQHNVQEADITLLDLESADEVFITSAIRDIQPVETVDSWHYKAPGPVTFDLTQMYREFAEGGYQ